MEDPHVCRLSSLNRDLLADISSRLDGSTLASMACTCSTLHRVARDQMLWKRLYHSTWPSTSLSEAQHLLSSSDYHKFYADSYPLLSYQTPANIKLNTKIYPSDYASLVDVYYKNQCVFSKVLDGITTAVNVFDNNGESESSSVNQRWFLNDPFKLYMLNNQDDDIENGEVGSTSPIEYISSQDGCTQLMDEIRLSWVLLDRKNGKAVNLSSWRPTSIKRCWPYQNDYGIKFESIIPNDVLPHKLVKCLIEARCRVTKTETYPIWKEISMLFENMMGAHVNGGTSLVTLNQALYSARSTDHLKIKMGKEKFETMKNEILYRRNFNQTLEDWLCLLTEVAIFLVFCCSFMKPLL